MPDRLFRENNLSQASEQLIYTERNWVWTDGKASLMKGSSPDEGIISGEKHLMVDKPTLRTAPKNQNNKQRHIRKTGFHERIAQNINIQILTILTINRKVQLMLFTHILRKVTALCDVLVASTKHESVTSIIPSVSTMRSNLNLISL